MKRTFICNRAGGLPAVFLIAVMLLGAGCDLGVNPNTTPTEEEEEEEEEIPSVEDLLALIAALGDDNTAANPYEPDAETLAEVIFTTEDLKQLTDGIIAAGKYAALDLSECDIQSIGSMGYSQGSPNDYVTALILPEALTSIVSSSGAPAFAGWNGLKTLVIAAPGLEVLSASAFLQCEALTSVNLSGCTGLTEIAASAFENCFALKTVVLPNSVTTVGNRVFMSCPLETVNFPTSLVTIGNMVFYLGDTTSTGLTEVVLPDSLETIGTFFFRNYGSLATVTALAETPPALNTNHFVNCNALANIYVPEGSVDTYKSATRWSSFATKISAITE
jgi:hypothetical protein